MVRQAVAAPPEFAEDDRLRDAPFWYLHLRLEQLREAGTTNAQITAKTGISKVTISQIGLGNPNGGVLTIIRFARIEGGTPGELLDKAIEWWRTRGGPDYRDRRVIEIAEKRVQKVKKKTGRPKGRLPLPGSVVQRPAKLALPRKKTKDT